MFNNKSSLHKCNKHIYIYQNIFYVKNFLTIILTLFCLTGHSQLGKYDVTVTSTITPPGPWLIGDNVQFCVTVDNFNECNVAWFDGLQVEFVGFSPVSYDSDPGVSWLNSTQSTDEPAGWLGWSYDWTGNPNQTWNDYGEPGSGPWTFCFTLQVISTVTQSVDVSIWSDHDTGGWGSGCGTAGNPDGPYNIWFSNTLPVELISFDVDCQHITWYIASEVNNKEFVVEQSINGEVWDTYKIVGGRGNSNDPKIYSILNQTEGLVYFRLKQIDYDGTEEILSLKTSECYIENMECVYYNVLGQRVDELYQGLKYRVCE